MLVTPIYAALLGFLLCVLSVRVIRIRRQQKVGVGDDGQPALIRAIRAQSNFIEYTPFTLLLIYFVEQQSSSVVMIHLLGLGLLMGRLIHAYGISQVQENYRFRIAGMAMTFTTIVSACLTLLSEVIF